MAASHSLDGFSGAGAPLLFLSAVCFIVAIILYIREQHAKSQPKKPAPSVQHHRRRRHH